MLSIDALLDCWENKCENAPFRDVNDFECRRIVSSGWATFGGCVTGGVTTTNAKVDDAVKRLASIIILAFRIAIRNIARWYDVVVDVCDALIAIRCMFVVERFLRILSCLSGNHTYGRWPHQVPVRAIENCFWILERTDSTKQAIIGRWKECAAQVQGKNEKLLPWTYNFWYENVSLRFILPLTLFIFLLVILGTRAFDLNVTHDDRYNYPTTVLVFFLKIREFIRIGVANGMDFKSDFT